MEQIVKPARSIAGEITVPGDKSISHRALMLAALCRGTVRIENLSAGQDVQSTANCLRALGVKIGQVHSEVRVNGAGVHGLKAPDKILDAGNSGTTMRLLAGILAAQPFTSTLTGDDSLRKRDMSRIIEPLCRMGAKITSKAGLAPLTITGGNLKGIRHALPVASAQVKSCVLLAGLLAAGTTAVIQPSPCRDHTERMLRFLGAPVKINGLEVSIEGGWEPEARDFRVPGDLSSAAFFIAAAALIPGSNLTVRRVGVNPTRAKFLDLLKKMGARITLENARETAGEPAADLRIKSSPLRGIEIRRPDTALVLDEIPVLAVLASQAQGETVIADALELKTKESDRIKTVVENLKKMGARIQELPDGLRISGPAPLRGARLDSFGDHRIAMAFAVAGLAAEGETVIQNAEWAGISFPGFFELLYSITR